jgi:oligoendopeptidase F
VLRRNLDKTYDELVMAQKLFIQANEQRFDAVQRRSEIQAIVRLLQEQRTANAAFESLAASLAALVEAHRQLPTAFDLQAVSLEQRLRDFITEGQRIKKYYDSLNK